MTLHWLSLSKETSIYEQLLIEEALLRYDDRNFCIVSEGSKESIVMGISGKIDELVDKERAKEFNLPILRRFSGGGTVVVDDNTLFVTFIFQKSAHSFAPFPEKIMQWTEKIYAPIFSPHPFSLKENDYVLGEKKFGGNAQYIKKERFLHHTSFLWDFSEERMRALLHPKKTPSYRQQRSHSDFLCKLKEIFPSKSTLFEKLQNELSQHFTLEIIEQSSLCLPADGRVSTQIL
jgi:lipoate-protein ligase A